MHPYTIPNTSHITCRLFPLSSVRWLKGNYTNFQVCSGVLGSTTAFVNKSSLKPPWEAVVI